MVRSIGQWMVLGLFCVTLALVGALTSTPLQASQASPAATEIAHLNSPLPKPIPNGMCTSSSDCPPGMICKRGMCVVPF